MRDIIDCWNQIGVEGDRSCDLLVSHIHCHHCPVYSQAGRSLLEREIPPDYARELTQRLAQPKEEGRVSTLSIASFRLQDEWFALDIDCIEEVIEVAPLHRLPHSRKPELLGMVSIRGEILPCVSLRLLVGLNPAQKVLVHPTQYQRMVVMVQPTEGIQTLRWVFPVDEMAEISRLHPEDLQPIPSNASQSHGTYGKAIVTLAGKSITLLDESLLFYSLAQRIL